MEKKNEESARKLRAKKPNFRILIAVILDTTPPGGEGKKHFG